MNFSFRTLLIAVTSLLFCLFFTTSCADDKLREDVVTVLDPSLGIETHQMDLLQGKTVLDKTNISYEVTADKGDYYIKFSIEEHLLEAWINFTTETITQDGHDAVLTAAQKEVMLKFVNQFGKALVNSNGNTSDDFEIGRMEYSFLRAVEYWSQAPQGFVHSHKVSITDITYSKGTGDDGVACITRGNTYLLQFSGTNNVVTTRTRVAGYNAGGTYGCMGRCGANCGWGAPSAWTLDCFEHDQCSAEFRATGGSSHPICGDEYDEAVDDFIWGVRWGCRG